MQRWRLLAAVLVIVAVTGGWLLNRNHDHGSPPVEALLPRASTVVAPSGAKPDATIVLVHITGAVAKPGVYSLEPNARVRNALEAAGGATAEADLESVNLAAKVRDGERIYLLRKGQKPPPPAAGVAVGSNENEQALVDLNSATEGELDTLPGIGPATAAAIVRYREASGPFASVQDLARVKGIGPSKLNDLMPHVRV